MTEKNETQAEAVETAETAETQDGATVESTQAAPSGDYQSGVYQADGALAPSGEQSEYEPTAEELEELKKVGDMAEKLAAKAANDSTPGLDALRGSLNKLEQAEKLASGAPVDVPGPELDGPASDASDLIDAAELSTDGDDNSATDSSDASGPNDHTAELTELSKFSDMAMAMELNRRRAAVQLARQLEASERGPKADPERVRELVVALGDPKTIRYQPGHLVQWREGMKIASWPAYGEAVVVVRHLPAGEGLNDPDKQPMQCNSGEVFDLEVGCLVAGEDGEQVLGTYMLPSRRMTPAQ